MLFPTVRFALFFMATWGAFIAVRDRPVARRLALLAASWVFYASWNWRWLALPSVPVVQVTLPLGISFLTFQAISYLVEVHRGVTAPAPLLDEAVWLSFFATVVSGPITRPSELIPQLDRVPRSDDASAWFVLILRGLFKKVVLASYLATTIVDEAFASGHRPTAPHRRVAVRLGGLGAPRCSGHGAGSAPRLAGDLRCRRKSPAPPGDRGVAVAPCPGSGVHGPWSRNQRARTLDACRSRRSHQCGGQHT